MATDNIEPVELKQASEILHQQLKPHFQRYFNEIGESYLSVINDFGNRYKQYLIETEGDIDQPKRIEIERAFKEYQLSLINKQRNASLHKEFSTFVNDYLSNANAAIEPLEETIRVNETFKPFTLSNSVNPVVFLRKLWLNFKFYSIVKWRKTSNSFRKLLRWKLLDLEIVRQRKVPFQNMAYTYLVNSFLQKALPLEQNVYRHMHQELAKLWEFTDQLDKRFQVNMQNPGGGLSIKQKPEEITINNNIVEKISSLHAQTSSEWLSELDNIADTILNSFAGAFTTVDTVELSRKKYRQTQLFQSTQKIQTWHAQKNAMWQNTRLALFDDWAVDVEVTLLFYSVFDEFNFMRDKVREYVEKHISKKFDSINAFFESSSESISNAGQSKSTLLLAIADEKQKAEQQLVDEQLTLFIEKLTGSFDPFFEELVHETNTLVELLSENRGFIRKKNYFEGVTGADVKYISPKELLKFEALPVFIAEIMQLERSTNDQLEKMRINIMGLGTVSNFALESAQLMLEADGKNLDDAIQTVNDGYDRALKHLENAAGIISFIQDNIAVRLSKAINQFDHDILKLKNTENLFELNLKIVRIKAVEQTEQYKKQVLIFLTELLPRLKNYGKELNASYQQMLNRFRKRLGISYDKKFLSFELSEFLDQTHQTLQQLPFVYQRLFRLKPTDEDRFFVNRISEIGMLEQAFQNWKKDRFVTVAIIGDKGSGITSLINYYLKKNQTKLPVFLATLDCKIYENEKYFSAMGRLLGNKSFKSNIEIIDHLNNAESNCIVIIENLQHMFLKKVNGFDCMNLFFELMAHTMKKVLWVGVYTNHSWNYLDRTIHVSNYFTDEIYIEPLSRESIEQIIFKRNHMSGYQIVFEPDDETLASKTYQKLDDIGKQEKLRSDYFSTLAWISSGNISLSQLYWLRSTKMNSNDTIIISSIKEIDFSFIKRLSGDELFVMQALIIHDGLELDDFSVVMNKPIIVCRNLLTPLFEKGLLIKPKSKYNIHPLVFKPLVAYLASKNFIN